MTRIIALANQKGGTGKTTTAINLVAGLVRQGQKVLFIDLDPQANATAVFLGMAYVAGPNPGLTIYDVLTGKAQAHPAIRTIELPGNERLGVPPAALDILPSHIHLAVAEQDLISIFQREGQLHRALQSVEDTYQIIVIDCPPSLGLLTINGLMAAHEVLVPIEPGFFPLIGLGLLRKTIETVKTANPRLRLMGLLPVRVNRTNLATNTLDELTNTFSNLVLSPIPERVIIGEANAHNQDIFVYAPHSDGAAAYTKLVEEVLQRGEIN